MRAHLLVFVLLASDAWSLELIATADTSGTASDVELVDTLVYLADGTSGFRIFDVSEPTSPTQVGAVDTPGNAENLAVEDGRVYVATGGQGLRIFDATDPSAPAALGTLAAWADDVAVRDGYAYVVDRFAGFLVVDVTNPAAPAVVASLPNVVSGRRLFLHGDRAYVTGGSAAHRIDISDPTAPSAVGQSFVQGIVESDGSLYQNEGFVWVAGPTYTATTSGISVVDFDAFDRFVVTASSAGIQIWDFSGPFEPEATRLSGVSFGGPTSAPIQDMHVVDGRAYVALGSETTAAGSLQIVDVIDPANPIPLGVAHVGQSVRDVEVVKSLGQTIAYTVQRDAGLSIANVTDPAAPVTLGSLPIGLDVQGIDVVGGFAYVAAGSLGVLSVDVSDPAHPVLRDQLGTPGRPTAISVRNGIAWVADDVSHSVRIIDVSNPANLVEIGSLPEANRVFDVALSGDLAYVAATGAGLRVYNVANPAAPIPLGGNPVVTWSVAVAGRTIWANTWSDVGLAKLDVSDPSDPKLRARIPAGGSAGRFAAFGRLLYGMSPFGTALAIWDGDTAKSLHHAGALLDTLPLTPSAIAVDVPARLVYVADGANGLRVVDLAGDLAALPCRNVADDDGDGLVDAADPGCAAWGDPSERPDCDDGIDQDGDALADYPSDPGCANKLAVAVEDPQCMDGVDNDGDGAADHPADAQCASPTDDGELPNPSGGGCGLGVELVVLLLLLRARAQMRRSRPRQ